jgi:hypothetical protein
MKKASQMANADQLSERNAQSNEDQLWELRLTDWH